MWPSLIVDVRSASRAITGIDSCHRTWLSYVQPYSNPCASASFVSSIRRWYGGSGRTVTPKLSNSGTPRSRAGKEAFSRESRRVATWPYYLFAIAAGAMLPVQFGINAQLASWVGSPLRATLVSFVVGAAVLGALYVLGSVVTAPKLGAAALFAFILAGQALASLAVDHFGWVGFDEDPITPGRLLGMALVAAGLAAVR